MQRLLISLRLIPFIIILSILSSPLYAIEHNGKKLFMYGDSAISIGRGGTGVASRGADLFYRNPAAIAETDQFSLSMNFGTLPIQTTYYNPDLSLAIPTSYGVIGSSLRYFNFSESDTFANGYGATFGVGREITRQFLLGFSLSFFYGHDSGDSYFTGGSAGAIYRFNGMSGTGFGFFEPSIGASLHFGYPFGQDSDNTEFNSATIGYQLTFFKVQNLRFTLYNEATSYNYRYYPVSIGLETLIFNAFTVRAGGTVMNEYDYGDFTAGLGYNFLIMNIEGSINYSLCYYTDGILVHNIGLSLQLGLTDREPPVTRVNIDSGYISPNYDGIQDYIVLDIDVSDSSTIKGWRLQILDESENLITEFRMSDRDITDQLTFKNLFYRLFHKKEAIIVPESILWDGTDSKRLIVPDGRYYYAFNAWDEHDNISSFKKGIIYVDNTPPQIEAQAPDTLFSPNKDGRKDELIINQKVSTAIDDIWYAEIKNDQKITVRKYRWTGFEIPKRFVWDGTDDNGSDVPEGVYDYSVRSVDKAGNKTISEIEGISLTRKYEIADCTLQSGYYSHRINIEIPLFAYLSSQTGLETWGVSISDAKKNPVRDITGYEYQKIVQFNGKDNEGIKLSDGEYFVCYTALFLNGNMPQSFEKRLIIDSTPPDLGISHSPGLFSPDNDGENDHCTLMMKGNDEFGIKTWKLTIYSQTGYIFKTFEGKGSVPSELKWDGYGDSGEIVESAADYFTDIEAFDMAGNYSRSSKDRIKIDVLVLVTERGLKMQISTIEFVLNSADILGKGRKILSRVVDLLQKYEKYNVVIEGHTDDVGTEEHNLDLSEKRAKSVMNYLIDKGIEARRLSFFGMGETTPLYPNSSEENRRRNRRVEFLLQKK